MPKIHIFTMHVCAAFAARVYDDPGRQSYILLDRQIDFQSYRRYELTEDPTLALRIEYTAYYNAVQTVLFRLSRSKRILADDLASGFADWLARNPIPLDLPRTRLSTAFCPVPTTSLSSISSPDLGEIGGG